MTKQEALREAANKIEGVQVVYCWASTETCNCGVLAQVVLGLSRIDLFKIMKKEFYERSSWDRLTKNEWVCSISSVQKTHAFLAMHAIGMTDQEIIELENLSNLEICRRGGVEFEDIGCGANLFRDSSINVIRYMRAWADMLDEQSEITASASAEDIEFRPSETITNNLVPLEAK